MPPLWHFDGNQARFSINGELSGVVDLLRPASGLALDGRGAGVCAFAVDLSLPAQRISESEVDVWARDNDLVATYPATDERPTRGQVYWRVQRCGPKAAPVHAIDLIVSVQTHLLDSDPEIRVRSRVAAGMALRLIDQRGQTQVLNPASSGPLVLSAPFEPACFLLRLPDHAATYAEMVHPNDFIESTLSLNPEGHVELSNKLFPGRLEKGVILRSRLRALILPLENDVALASDCYSDFADSEPPLTT